MYIYITSYSYVYVYIIYAHPEAENVQYCDAHRGKVNILAIFTESSEINQKKFLFCGKPTFGQQVKNSQIMWLNNQAQTFEDDVQSRGS